MGEATRENCAAPVAAAAAVAFISRNIAMSAGESAAAGDFYVRHYVGHKGKFGHEFLEFEFTPDGRLRYANNSNYKGDARIRKEVFVGESVMAEVKRIVEESEIVKEDDKHWPEPNRDGRQEFEVVLGSNHISFATAK